MSYNIVTQNRRDQQAHTTLFIRTDGASTFTPAVLRAALCCEPDPAQEHGPFRGPLQQDQGPRPRAETLPGKDPGLRLQEQVSRLNTHPVRNPHEMPLLLS